MATDETARGVLSIDLGALVRNYRKLQALASPAEVGAVVKANGYGLGAKEIATALAEAGCGSFFVAHPAEGLALRCWLKNARIFVLHGLPEHTEVDVADAALIPVINHPDELCRYSALGVIRGERMRVALQLDTGM